MESQAHPLSIQISPHESPPVMINMPASPSGIHIMQAKRIVPASNAEELPITPRVAPRSASLSCYTDKRFDAFRTRSSTSWRSSSDRRFDPFRTWSGKLERQISNLRGIPHEHDVEANNVGSPIAEAEPAPEVDRYIDALEGPELDTLKPSEVSVLPKDEKWPFLLRFPITTFGMCLGVSSQAIMWKAIAQRGSLISPHVCLKIALILWCISVALMAAVSIIYALKIIFYFEAVKREYYHPVRINFFFAPSIVCLFLTLGVPPDVTEHVSKAVWYALMPPILILGMKIYGQWMSGGKRRLSKVANPSNHISVAGNFVVALLGASVGLKEEAIFFFAVGLAHYIIVFVTLYQRLPTNDVLPKDLHPVFFLFVAAPTVASLAWEKINGDFDNFSRIVYFIAMFLYASLAVRINFFRGIKFSLAWWAYTFPMTGAAIATVRYSLKVSTWFTKSLALGLAGIATCAVLSLFVLTVIHTFVLHDLFPNDMAIAVAGKRPESSRRRKRVRQAGSSDSSVAGGASPQN